MVTLPELDTYSQTEKEALSRHSPIFHHYYGLLKRKPISFSDKIRIEKHQSWLKCALATFTKKVSTEEVCLFWTQESEKILQQTWSECDLGDQSVCLLGFGKIGSRELNLSSDIDIVLVRSNDSDSTSINRNVKKFISLLSEKTAFGFCYRIDLDLRPGGDLSPMVPTKENFFSYFNEYLEAWNRISFIRMRPILGDKVLGKQLADYCQPLAYPRRLDFSIIQEIKSIRSKINIQWRRANEPLDIKLCPGGIRDIELYIQSLQVIYGGKEPLLQTSSITDALSKLQQIGALKNEEKDFLCQFYWQLRSIENLIHVSEDIHTYRLEPRFWESAGETGTSSSELNLNLEKSHKIVSDFFDVAGAQTPQVAFDIASLSKSSQKAIHDIQNLKSHSLKKSQTDELKNRILNQFLEHLESLALDRELALQSFRDFIFSIKSKSSIFHLLDRYPKLVENLARLFSISPFVGQLLSRRPELVDSYALGQVAIDDTSDIEILLESLVDFKLLGQLSAVTQLFKTNDIDNYCLHLSQQADLIIGKLLTWLKQEFKSEPPAVLCMGKWSGFEMGVQSDLDFVFLTDEKPTPIQIKMARRLINLLTNHSKAGKLYNIDLRLKPNESAGPLILQKESFYDFIRQKADPWQRQAYLRSRLISHADFFLTERFENLRISPIEKMELDKLHLGLLTSNQRNSIDIKSCMGGIIHTEFTLQKLCLLNSKPPKLSSTREIINILDQEPGLKGAILNKYQKLRMIEQTLQICNDNSRTKVSQNQSNLSRVTQILGFKDLFSELRNLVTDQQKLLKALT